MDPPVYADAEEAEAAEKAAKKAAKKKKREREKAKAKEKENKRKRGEEAAGRPSTESQDDEAAVVPAPVTIVYNSGSLAIHKLEIADLVQDEEILKNALVSKPRDQLPRMLSIQGWLETVKKATKIGAPGTPEQVRARAGRCSSHPPLCVGPHTDCVLRCAACAQFPLLAELRKLPRAVVLVNPVDHARTSGGVFSPEQLTAAGYDAMTVAPGQRLNMDEDDDLQLLAEVVVAAAYMAWKADPELYGKVRCQLPARLCLSAG